MAATQWLFEVINSHNGTNDQEGTKDPGISVAEVVVTEGRHNFKEVLEVLQELAIGVVTEVDSGVVISLMLSG